MTIAIAAAPTPQPNRSGMVCFNRSGQVCLISALTKKEIFVLPKGHIEQGEESYEAAEREFLEETGIKAVVDTPGDSLGLTSYRYCGEDVVVEWWSGLATRLSPDSRCLTDLGRTTRWVDWRVALDLLSFPDLRNMVRRAVCVEGEEDPSGPITLISEKEVIR